MGLLRDLNNKDFDDVFFDTPRDLINIKPRKIVLGLFGMWAIGATLFVGFWGTVAYIGWHFLSKYW